MHNFLSDEIERERRETVTGVSHINELTAARNLDATVRKVAQS